MLTEKYLQRNQITKKLLTLLIVSCLLLSGLPVYAKPVKVSGTAAEYVDKKKTLEKFGNLNFGVSVPQDIFKQNEEELIIQEKMVAEIKKLRLENAALNEKNTNYVTLLKLAEDLSAAKDQKIVLLEGIISKAEQLNVNNDKIIKNLQTELEVSKQESKFLKEELDKIKKTRNKRSVITGIIGFIAGVAIKVFIL